MDRTRYTGWANQLRVLAHPTRLAIVDALKDGTKCVTDVCDLLSLPQPNLSQHLAILRREGMVDFTEDGTKRCYFLASPALVRAILQVFDDDLNGRLPEEPAPSCCIANS